MGVLLSGPHEVGFEHRRVSDSCVKQKSVYRLNRAASRVILSEAITLLVKSAEKLNGSTQLWRTFVKFKLPQVLRRSTETVNIPQFDLNTLAVQERIGQGSFSNVFTAMFKEPGSEETETVVVQKND